MLDAVDKVIKKHVQNLFAVENILIPVFSLATADADDQTYTQAGTAATADQVQFPFASLVRLPSIDITDNHMTKMVHTYTGYKPIEGSDVRLTYYRCTLHYSITIFAENRKLAEDLATALYGRLRRHCQVKVAIQLPIELDKNEQDVVTYAAAEMDSDIVLDSKIEEVNPIKLDAAQIYKCRIAFELRNVNVYHVDEDTHWEYTVSISSKVKDRSVSPFVDTVYDTLADDN